MHRYSYNCAFTFIYIVIITTQAHLETQNTCTELSKYAWSLKGAKTAHTINWRILKNVEPIRTMTISQPGI